MRPIRVVVAGPVREPRLGPEESAVLAMALVMAVGGLLLVTVWMRLLVDLFGGAAATTPVFVGFLLAFTLGVLGPGRSAARHSNPLFIHTALQAAVAVVAFALPATLPVVDMFHGGGVARFSPGPVGLIAWRTFVAAGTFLPGAGLLGASLPVLGALLLHERPGLALRTGSLAAALTTGAALGAGLAGLLLLPHLGLRATSFLAILLLLGGAVLSLALAPVFRDRPAGSTAARDPFTDADSRLRRAVLLGVAASGFTTFVAVSGANRIVPASLAPAPSLLVLGTFLVAHGLGASALGRLADRPRNPEAWLAALAVAFPVAVLATLPLAPLAPRLGELAGSAGSTFLPWLTLLATVGLPAFLLGGVFPLAARIAIPGAPPGSRWSALVAAHLAGLLSAAAFSGLLFRADPGSRIPVLAAALVGLLAAAALITALPPARRTGPPRLAVLGLLGLLFLAVQPGGPRSPGDTVPDPGEAALRTLLVEMYLPRAERVVPVSGNRDPRTALRVAGEPQDAVLLRVAPGTSDPGSPFTGELLGLVRERLAPGGVAVVSLRTDHLEPAGVRAAVATFLDVFPAAHLWSGSPTTLVLVGGTRPLRPDFWRLEQAQRVRGTELRAAGLAPEAQVLAQFVTDRDGLLAFAGNTAQRIDRDGGGLSFLASRETRPVTPLAFADVRCSPIDVLVGYEHRPGIAREAERYAKARYLALRVLAGERLPAGQRTPLDALDLALALAEEHLCLTAWAELAGEEMPAGDLPDPAPEPRLAGGS